MIHRCTTEATQIMVITLISHMIKQVSAQASGFNINQPHDFNVGLIGFSATWTALPSTPPWSPCRNWKPWSNEIPVVGQPRWENGSFRRDHPPRLAVTCVEPGWNWNSKVLKIIGVMDSMTVVLLRGDPNPNWPRISPKMQHSNYLTFFV